MRFTAYAKVNQIVPMLVLHLLHTVLTEYYISSLIIMPNVLGKRTNTFSKKSQIGLVAPLMSLFAWSEKLIEKSVLN